MFHKNAKTLMITFIVAILVLPAIPVEAEKSNNPSTITVERISSIITRFEETIPLNIPDPRIPEGASYTVSVYAIKVRGGIVLIDCGDDTLAEDLHSAVSSTLSQPIKAVYLTHYHADHAGAGKYFQDIGVPVYAPQLESWFIQNGAAVQPGIPDEFTYTGYTPDGFYENMVLESGFEIIPAPGHTMGAVHVEYSKGSKSYLFTSDTILSMESFNPYDTEYTFELTFQTAYQNYGLELGGFGPFWTLQKETLNGMLCDVNGYELVFTAHTPILDAEEAADYVYNTISTLELFPFLPPM